MENLNKIEKPKEQELSLEERLEIAENENKELKNKNKELEETISIISHDLKGPLGSMTNTIRLLQSDLENGEDIDKEELIEIMGVIHKSGDNIFHLLERLLEWNQLKKEGKNLEMSTLHLANEIDSSINVLVEIAKAKKITLENKTSGDIDVLANSNMLHTVIRNLVSNAIKYTDLGGSIVINSENKGDVVEMSVVDNGMGITPEKMEKLFKNIVESTEGTDSEKGTGLGLMLCKEMVAKMNGSIQVKSELEKGTTFIVTLPSALK